MAIKIQEGPRPTRKCRGMKHVEIYETARRLTLGQWFVWTEGKPACLAAYRRMLDKLSIGGVEVYVSTDDQVVFAHSLDATRPGPAGPIAAAAPKAEEPVKRGPGRPPGSGGGGGGGGLKPPRVDPRVAALGRR